jgi:hypothetical protein
MTALPPAIHQGDALHIARSRVIDAFGELECEIVGLLRETDAKILKAPLSQKIVAVRKIAPGPRYSKRRRDLVQALLDELSPLLERRAELAHGTLQIVRLRGEKGERAGFSNPATQPEHGENMVLYREEDLTRLANDVRAVARKFRA